MQIEAAKELLNRGYGKSVALSADLTDRLDALDDATLGAALDALDAAIAAAGTSGGEGRETGAGKPPSDVSTLQ